MSFNTWLSNCNIQVGFLFKLDLVSTVSNFSNKKTSNSFRTLRRSLWSVEGAVRFHPPPKVRRRRIWTHHFITSDPMVVYYALDVYRFTLLYSGSTQNSGKWIYHIKSNDPIGFQWSKSGILCTRYTSKFFLTGYVGLIWRSTTVATASQSTVEGTMRVLWGYFMHSSFSAFWHSSVSVPA